MMTAVQVHAFFKGYAEAFSDQSAERLQEIWTFPAFMSFEGKQVVLESEAFLSNTRKLCAFYSRQGVVRVDKEVLGLSRLTETTATVRTVDTLFAADGSVVVTWEHVYLLSETKEGIRVAAAMPDNEIRAWRDRGTPLGN